MISAWSFGPSILPSWGWWPASFCRNPRLCCPCPAGLLGEGSPPHVYTLPVAPDGLASWVLLGSGGAPGSPAYREIVKGEAAYVTPRVSDFAWSSVCPHCKGKEREALVGEVAHQVPGRAAVVPPSLSATHSLLPPFWTCLPVGMVAKCQVAHSLPVTCPRDTGVICSWRGFL